MVSPSGSYAAHFPRRLSRALDMLRARGFRVRLMPHAVGDDGLGSAADAAGRAQDIEAAFADPEVRLVVSAIGGLTACRVLDFLDPAVLAEHPTWFCGYSDVTALLLPLWSAAKVHTLYGPQVLPQLGEFGGCLDYTWSGLSQAIGTRQLSGTHLSSNTVVGEVLNWDIEDDRIRRLDATAGPRTIRPGRGSGHAVAANLDVLVRLAGTPFAPELSDSVLLLEVTETVSPAGFESALWQLARSTDLSRCAGLAFGRFLPSSSLAADGVLDRVLDRVLPSLALPVVAGLDIGHSDPQATVVCGASIRLDADQQVVIAGEAIFPLEGGVG